MQRLVLFLLVAACSGDPELVAVQVGTPAQANALQRLELTADHPWSVIDPSFPDFDSIALEFVAVGHSPTSECSVEIQMDELTRTLDADLIDGRCTALWDGMLEEEPAPVGAVEVVASLTRGDDVVEAHSPLDVVRVGIDEVQLSGDGRVGLLYRALGGVRYGYYEVDASVPPWRNRGPSSSGPEPWDILTSPPLDPADPEGVERNVYNLPVGWVSGEVVEGRASWVVDGDVSELRLVSDSVTFDDDAWVENGSVVDFEASDLVPGVGRFDVELVFHLEARNGEDWARLPGSVRTQHRIYGLSAHPQFDYDEIPHRPWVDVLDQVADWMDEATADPDAVGAAIVEGVFYELGLQYDNERGASEYTSYPGGTYSDAAFNLSRFQELADGNIINCSDAASIVSTYANMVGLEFRYHIIRHRTSSGFELNYLHAIGRDWGASPFVSGRTSFRYHAVVGPPDTRIFDSTLALDGDGDPGSAPHELLLVQGLTQMDYLVGLSPEWDRVRVFEDDQVRVR